MNGDLPDELARETPGLSRLIGALTSAATPAELAGEQAALTMFRQAQAIPARSRRRAGPGRWLAAAAALSLAGGFAAAGFAAVLPAPLQHVAYRALGFAGVPDSRPRLSPPGSSHPRLSPGGGETTSEGRPGSAPAPGPSSARPVRSPGSSAPAASARLTASVAKPWIVAGGRLVVTALLTERGGVVPGSQARLLERVAGRPGWRLAAVARIRAGGRAVLVVAHLRANASFRVTGPDGTASRQMNVVVVPPVTVTVRTAPGRRSLAVVARCPLAGRGDVVELQAWSAGRWRTLRARRLGGGAEAAFAVPAREVSITYRVVVLATPAHGQSASAAVTVAPRGRAGGR